MKPKCNVNINELALERQWQSTIQGKKRRREGRKQAWDEWEMTKLNCSKPLGKRANREERRCEEGSKQSPTVQHTEPLEGWKTKMTRNYNYYNVVPHWWYAGNIFRQSWCAGLPKFRTNSNFSLSACSLKPDILSRMLFIFKAIQYIAHGSKWSNTIIPSIKHGLEQTDNSACFYAATLNSVIKGKHAVMSVFAWFISLAPPHQLHLMRLHVV